MGAEIEVSVAAVLEDLVLLLQLLRANPARIKVNNSVIFIGGLNCFATDRAGLVRFTAHGRTRFILRTHLRQRLLRVRSVKNVEKFSLRPHRACAQRRTTPDAVGRPSVFVRVGYAPMPPSEIFPMAIWRMFRSAKLGERSCSKYLWSRGGGRMRTPSPRWACESAPLRRRGSEKTNRR